VILDPQSIGNGAGIGVDVCPFAVTHNGACSFYAETQQEASHAGDPGGAPGEKLLVPPPPPSVSVTVTEICHRFW